MVIGSLVILGTISLMAVQSWNDRREAELQAYNHLADTAKQVERSVVQLFATNRSIANSLVETVRRNHDRKSGCALACSEDLKAIRRVYAELVPGIEMLLLDAEGRSVADTDPDLVSRLVGLQDITKLFATRGGVHADVRFTRDLHNKPAIMMARAIRTPSGDLEATAILLEPLAILDPAFDVPRLGPGRNVTLVDSSQTLLIRKPDPLAISVGQKLPPLDFSKPGIGPGSFYTYSTVDGIDRLIVKRELPYALTSGGMTLLVGMSNDDYLDGWVHSTKINILIGIILLGTWSWAFHAMRKGATSQAQLQSTVTITRKVLMELPVPVAVVSKSGQRILRSNTAMIEMFGAIAGEDQALSRLFCDDGVMRLFLDGSAPTALADLVSRRGIVHAELHRTDVGNLDGNTEPCWLLAFVDVSERVRREQKFQREATTDPLTGLANRRHFATEAEQAVRNAKSGQPLAVLALDLDHFKQVNDLHGHDTGDLVLSMIARVFKSTLRDGDLAARMGGEEFAALLPNTPPENAMAVGERIRQAVAATPIMLPNGTVLTVTISIGMGRWEPDDVDIQDALKRADEALYRAKESGRNRVVG